jgi:uncharacterized Zn-finger protein
MIPLSAEAKIAMVIHAAPLIPSDTPQQQTPKMAAGYVKFKNDQGLAEIAIGVTEFQCIGVSPPHDHPHTYHKIGEQGFVHCLYCNTKYVYRPRLDRSETDPPGNVFADESDGR